MFRIMFYLGYQKLVPLTATPVPSLVQGTLGIKKCVSFADYSSEIVIFMTVCPTPAQIRTTFQESQCLVLKWFGTKWFGMAQNINQFLVWHKKFGPAQNILESEEGRGISGHGQDNFSAKINKGPKPFGPECSTFVNYLVSTKQLYQNKLYLLLKFQLHKRGFFQSS